MSNRIRTFIYLGAFVIWSAAMLSLGNFANLHFVSKSHALEAPERLIVDLDEEHLAGLNLGEFAPYEQEYGNLVARGVDSFYTEDGEFSAGIWESKPGEMSFPEMGYYELMYVVDGSVTMTDTEGRSKTYTKGQGFVVPPDWGGTFKVGPDGLRKIWVVYMNSNNSK